MADWPHCTLVAGVRSTEKPSWVSVALAFTSAELITLGTTTWQTPDDVTRATAVPACTFVPAGGLVRITLPAGTELEHLVVVVGDTLSPS
jgi:hypothetical protein